MTTTTAISTSTIITDTLIRKESGQYDPEIISKLRLENLSIQRITGLDRCVSLVELSLSHNQITKINGLEFLVLLKRLDLSFNAIQIIENLDKLKALEWLDVRSNMMSDECNIDNLFLCSNLRIIYFQNHSGENSNPVCKLPKYATRIQQTLRSLEFLDGVSVKVNEEIRVLEDFLDSFKSEGDSNLETLPTQNWLNSMDMNVETSDKSILNEIKMNSHFQNVNIAHDQAKECFQESHNLVKKAQILLTKAST